MRNGSGSSIWQGSPKRINGLMMGADSGGGSEGSNLMRRAATQVGLIRGSFVRPAAVSCSQCT